MGERSLAQRIGTAVIIAVFLGGVVLVGAGLLSWDPFDFIDAPTP